MAVSFDLPTDIEQHLRHELGNLDQAAKEAALVELYRLDKLTHHQLSKALGLSRFETDGVLKRHKVTEDLLTVEEFRQQADDLGRIAGK
jgi:hypothetical protein